MMCFSDMVVLVGDLVDDTVEHLKSIVEPLGELSCPKGMYFVTGTYTSIIFFNEIMKGIEVMRNRTSFLRSINVKKCSTAKRGWLSKRMANIMDISNARCQMSSRIHDCTPDVLRTRQPCTSDSDIVLNSDVYFYGPFRKSWIRCHGRWQLVHPSEDTRLYHFTQQ